MTTYSTDARLVEAWRFHLAHGGYCEPPGRAASALHMARAELLAAQERDLTFTWENETESYEDVYGEPLEKGAIGPFWVACRDEDETVLASLGMVTLSSFDDPYRRVVEAELALEALDVLDERDQREADKLAGRATYAAGGAP